MKCQIQINNHYDNDGLHNERMETKKEHAQHFEVIPSKLFY